jgi:two-component system NtrC family sensor kinase
MPDGDGPGLYDWLSANRPQLIHRIGFVTGDTLGPSAGRFLARTGCPVIEKPFTPDDIAGVLKALVG